FNEQKRPELLDVVKIDGRWAQVIIGGDTVSFLDTGEKEPIDWSEYELTSVFRGAVFDVMKLPGQEFKEEEIDNIRWGPEAKKHPELKLEVRVFGEYVSKKKNRDEK
ncbi:MAG: hypothetical protein Q8P97_01160, partial [bacterium]|nr:hypothetical protein [bacterium]